MKKAKLTPEQVMHIKTTDMRSSHLTLVYDVSISTINRIKSGLAWKKFNTEKNVKRRAMSPAMRLPVRIPHPAPHQPITEERASPERRD